MIARLGVGLLCVAILLVGLELTSRLLIFGARGLDPRRVPWIGSGSIFDFVELDTDPAIGYETRPHLDRFMGLVHFRTNSFGMRDDEYPLEKPEGVFRVAVVGSSYGVPAGVEIEDAFHSLLERDLSAKLAPTRYEFLNFSVGTHMPSQFVAMLQLRALRFDPDLIIVTCTELSLSDFFLEWDLPPRPGVLEGIPSGARSWLLELIRSRLERKPERVPRLPGRRARGPDVISKLAQISRDTGIPIVVFRITYLPGPPTRPEKRLARHVRRAGLHYFDGRDAFRGIEPRSLWINRLDPHPNAAAHAIFAEALGEFLETEGLLAPVRR